MLHHLSSSTRQLAAVSRPGPPGHCGNTGVPGRRVHHSATGGRASPWRVHRPDWGPGGARQARLDVSLAIDARFSAFTSLQRLGPKVESVAMLCQSAMDETPRPFCSQPLIGMALRMKAGSAHPAVFALALQDQPSVWPPSPQRTLDPARLEPKVRALFRPRPHARRACPDRSWE
jgi:hypothetical protein